MAAIVTGDISTRYTTTSGSAGNSTSGTASGSLGKYASTSAWTSGVLHDLVRAITGGENAASTSIWRAIAVYNSNGANPWQNVVMYASAETSGGASVAFASDSTAASAIGGSSAQGLTATTETAPGGSVTGLSYSTPTTAATGVSLGDIASGFVKIVWLKVTPANTSALSADGFTWTFAGDTGSL